MKKLNAFAITIITLAIVFTSCSSDLVSPTADAQKVLERVDMKLVSDVTEYFYENNAQENTTIDLVDYNFYDNSASDLDFVVKLNDDKTLTIKLHNSLMVNPWENSGDSYGTFPESDLNEKFKYVTVQLTNGSHSESATYVSNIGGDLPKGGFLDVFRIVKYDAENMEILCRVNNMVLYKSGHTHSTLTIDGTFRGSLSFL